MPLFLKGPAWWFYMPDIRKRRRLLCACSIGLLDLEGHMCIFNLCLSDPGRGHDNAGFLSLESRRKGPEDELNSMERRDVLFIRHVAARLEDSHSMVQCHYCRRRIRGYACTESFPWRRAGEDICSCSRIFGIKKKRIQRAGSAPCRAG